MQLVLDVKDDYVKEVLGILDNLKNVMINSVTIIDEVEKKVNTDEQKEIKTKGTL